jgi:DNA-binding response OmpR family regulator
VRILVIEDDRTIATNLYEFLSSQGHVVDAAFDGITGMHLAATHPFDVIILDLGLSGMDGLTLCRRLRSEAQLATPVLMLTARDALEDKLKGFEAGADDYLVKPFALREVAARLAALHARSTGRTVRRKLQAGALELDLRGFSVRAGGREIRLPPKCVKLLEVLMLEPGRLFSRAELERAVWGDAQETSDTLRSHMHVLRRALGEAGADPVETVHGVGYRLKPDGPPR